MFAVKLGLSEAAGRAKGFAPLRDGKSPPRRQSRSPTKALILDCAERLFADHGYYGTSTHDIARALGIKQSLINYHFGSKEQLYRDVIARSAGPFCQLKTEALTKQLEKTGGEPAPVKDILSAFIHPVLAHLSEPETRFGSYARLLSQGAHLSRRPDLHAKFDEIYRPIVHKFVDELSRSIPEADRNDIMWALHFVHAALGSLTAPGNKIELWGDRLPEGADSDLLEQKLISLFSAGLKQMARQRNRS